MIILKMVSICIKHITAIIAIICIMTIMHIISIIAESMLIDFL